jgi:hypothetical protein
MLFRAGLGLLFFGVSEKKGLYKIQTKIQRF